MLARVPMLMTASEVTCQAAFCLSWKAYKADWFACGKAFSCHAGYLQLDGPPGNLRWPDLRVTRTSGGQTQLV